MLSLSMSGALTPLPNTLSWRAQGQLLSRAITTRILTINTNPAALPKAL
jgi:hypothetical protein